MQFRNVWIHVHVAWNRNAFNYFLMPHVNLSHRKIAVVYNIMPFIHLLLLRLM